MKNIKYLLLFIFTVTVIFGCNKDEEKETYNISRITEYPVFTLTGGYVLVNVGGTYSEPGVEAIANGESLPITEEITGRFQGANTLDVNTPDHYIISYSALNADNLPGTAERDVFVSNTGDLVNSIEGVYIAHVTTSGGEEWINQYRIMIWEVATDVYEISHCHGGKYGDGRGYGDDYNSYGATITVNDMASNDFSYTDGFIPGFGLSTSIYGFTVDPVTKTIQYSSELLGYGFQVYVTMVQVTASE